MNPDLFNMFAPQGDPYSMGMLFSQAAQNPDQMIPYLAAMGIEPPSKDGVFTPQASPFADMEFSSQNKPKGIPGIDSPAQDTTPRFQSPQQPADMSAWEDQTDYSKPAPVQMAPQPMPSQAPAAPPQSPVAGNPEARAPHNLVRSLLGLKPAGAPNPEGPNMASGDVFAAPNAMPPGVDPALGGGAFGDPKPQAPAGAPTLPQGAGVPLPKSRDLAVLGKLEGGNYGQMVDAGNGRTAYGAFGIMGENIPQWTKEVLGQAMTPEQFLANPEAQDRVAQAKFGDYRAKYGSGEAATRAWLAGEGGMNNPNRRDVFGTTPFTHADNYTRYAENLGQSKGAQGIGANGGVEVSARARPVEQPTAPDSPQAQAKKAATLADALKGVASPTVPEPLMPRGSAPPPPAPRPISGDNPIGALLALAMSGKKDPVSVLRLQQALGGK